MSNIPIKMFFNDKIKSEKNALEELNNLLLISNTIERIMNAEHDFFDSTPELLEVAITPDFHKGAGIPIGTVLLTNNFIIPQATGNDINCGMRVYTTNINKDKINFKTLEKNIRHIFFEGGRNIPMNNIQREALLKEGLLGLLETSDETKGMGLWKYFIKNQQEKDIERINCMGSLITNKAIGLKDFIGSSDISYDAQIGSIGGGNHFVEVQKIGEILDNKIANAWNLKKDQVIVMIHTGSVMIGHHCGTYIKEILKSIYPKNIKIPENNVYVLPKSEKYIEFWNNYWSLLNNAGNFAFANRMFLGLMMYKALSDELGEFEYNLLYDAPHNFIWNETLNNESLYIHRKGACTAKSMEQMSDTPFEYYGEPVFIPGSMGSSSYILAGLGNRDSLFSASHGAGRNLSRGDSKAVEESKFREFINNFNIITPINPSNPDIKNRPDIIKKWEDEIKAEAPYAYKEISNIIQTQVDNNIVKPVVRLEPIFTIKG